MKTSFLAILFVFFCFFLNSCKKDAVCACGVNNPAKKLPWLAELIEKAKTDETGNYLGSIWLENYKGQDIFVTDMALGSGGIAYWFFDCNGNHHVFVDKDDFLSFYSTMKLDVVIYSLF